MKNVFLLGVVVLAISLGYVLVNGSLANAQCVPVYGGGVSCPSVNIAINKQVAHPQTGSFVDNVGVNDPKFSVEQTVTFHLVVTNVGNSAIAQVVVHDVFPQFVNFVSGPGSFDTNSKTLTFEVTSLQVGESRTFIVQGKVVPENQLPSDLGTACVTNQSSATSNTGQVASDNAQFCIQRRVLGGQPGQPSTAVVVFPPSQVTQIPATGVNLLQLLALAPTALVGLLLRKRAVLT